MTVIGVAGAGVMGAGVAQNLAHTGHRVILSDVSEEVLEDALLRIERNCRLSRLMGGPDVDAGAVLSSIHTGVGAQALSDVDVVIENITENWDRKRELYQQLDELCKPETIFVVNTSAIPITKVAALTSRPDQVIGVHFMNPVPMKPAVELIPGYHTSPVTVARTRKLLAAMGKTPLPVKDACGFISNRVSHVFMNEAAYLVYEGVATAEAVATPS
jgi:3-hydroxybutyryl-CoA dehydrogenase